VSSMYAGSSAEGVAEGKWVSTRKSHVLMSTCVSVSYPVHPFCKNKGG
jgi:hypothetical protein